MLGDVSAPVDVATAAKQGVEALSAAGLVSLGGGSWLVCGGCVPSALVERVMWLPRGGLWALGGPACSRRWLPQCEGRLTRERAEEALRGTAELSRRRRRGTT